MTRALALTSGGLDSILAAKLIQTQGIDVIGICFVSAFFGSKNAEKMAEQVGLPLKAVDFTEEHLEMTKHPKNGYGKNMNPCIDCHAMMLKYAGRMLNEMEADFLITGEVLDQRPMSQNRRALDIVKKESEFEDKILRPLCALKLLPTRMEQEGLVDRSRLLGISGKSRKAQMELAEQLGIREYPTPAGGCLLTEPQFANRLRDLYNIDKESVTPADIKLIRLGRHFRLSPAVKVVSTRNSQEYNDLKALIRDEHILLDTAECAGSTGVIVPTKGMPVSEEALQLAAEIVARYSKFKDREQVVVKYRKGSEDSHAYITVKPAEEEKMRQYLL